MSPADIRAARERAGLTQTAAADLVGVSRVTWARYEAEAGANRVPMPDALWRYFLHVCGIARIPFTALKQ